MPKRLFLAHDLPDTVKNRLAALQVPTQGVRWVKPERMHLTLRFFGDMTSEQLSRLLVHLDTVRPAAFSIRLQGVGAFPVRDRPRVLWAGLTPEAPLHTLSEALRTAFSAAGFPPEDRPFRPHITLARLTRPNPSWFRTFMHQHRDLASPAFAVDAVTLFNSTTLSEGPRYDTIARFDLKG